MPRPCTVCSHPEREVIDQALVDGDSARKVAAKYRVSDDAVTRHRNSHLPATLAKAQEAKEVTQADGLLDRLLGLTKETADILREAREGGDNELALKAIARAEKQIELQAKLLGELKDGHTVNILVTPEWHRVRAVLVETLAPYPQARAAVAGVLREFNGHSG